KSLSLLWGLASGCWLDRLTSFSRLRMRLRIGVLGYAVVDEVTPLQEVDRGVFLGRLSFARSLDVRRHLLLVASSFG
ncbi:MAG: hypothetical protein WBX78_05505, partial [Pseudolabrys sp.]